MILNRTGAEFEYEGVTYTIGGAIVGTAESEYAGLYGRINAIHDGEDKETENETPDIYCEFDPPVMPHEVKALEDTFSDLYHQPKAIADIVLDMVIMAPEMIRPLDDLRSMRKRVNVFLVMEDWAVNMLLPIVMEIRCHIRSSSEYGSISSQDQQRSVPMSGISMGRKFSAR